MTDRDAYWRVDANIKVSNLAAMLYHLVFPKRQFHKLPNHVQESYCRDALRLLQHFGAKPS